VDTRSKILTPAAAMALTPRCVTIATGYFDLLRAEHARELGELGDAVRHRIPPGSLLVAVLPLSGAILSQRARAELVAALRMVDYVVAADHRDLEQLVAAIEPPEVIRFEAADAQRAQQLTEHVIDLFWHRKNR